MLLIVIRLKVGHARERCATCIDFDARDQLKNVGLRAVSNEPAAGPSGALTQPISVSYIGGH
jgi:hypothetical protein